MEIRIDEGSVQRLKDLFSNLGKDMRKEVHKAINQTAKQVRIQASRALKKELAVPSKILKKAIKSRREASVDSLRATILLLYGFPIPLKYFGARKVNTRKGGVSFRIDPKFNNRSVQRDLFIVDKYKGHVFKREGKPRGRIIRMNGPAPGDRYEKAGIPALAERVAREELPKQIQRRIRFLILKSQGKLRGNQQGN